MGTGLIVMGSCLFGMVVAIILTAERGYRLTTGTAASVVLAVVVSEAIIPLFPYDSEYFLGGILRHAGLILLPIAATAWIGVRLNSRDKEKP